MAVLDQLPSIEHPIEVYFLNELHHPCTQLKSTFEISSSSSSSSAAPASGRFTTSRSPSAQSWKPAQAMPHSLPSETYERSRARASNPGPGIVGKEALIGRLTNVGFRVEIWS